MKIILLRMYSQTRFYETDKIMDWKERERDIKDGRTGEFRLVPEEKENRTNSRIEKGFNDCMASRF